MCPRSDAPERVAVVVINRGARVAGRRRTAEKVQTAAVDDQLGETVRTAETISICDLIGQRSLNSVYKYIHCRRGDCRGLPVTDGTRKHGAERRVAVVLLTRRPLRYCATECPRAPRGRGNNRFFFFFSSLRNTTYRMPSIRGITITRAPCSV